MKRFLLFSVCAVHIAIKRTLRRTRCHVMRLPHTPRVWVMRFGCTRSVCSYRALSSENTPFDDCQHWNRQQHLGNIRAHTSAHARTRPHMRAHTSAQRRAHVRTVYVFDGHRYREERAHQDRVRALSDAHICRQNSVAHTPALFHSFRFDMCIGPVFLGTVFAPAHAGVVIRCACRMNRE
jgi:hypothetical protein